MSRSKYLQGVLALLFALCTGSVFAQAVTVVEFYNKTLDAYFITGRVNEQLALDGQSDFRRTGMTFDATAASGVATDTTRICRFYINLNSPPTSSHFYGREGVDCEQIQAQNINGFTYEGFDFAVAQPQGVVCPAGTKTVYRGFRPAAGGKTPNHRYMTSLETYNFARSQGFVGEDAVFCTTNAKDVTPTVESTQKCGTYYYPDVRISYQSINSEGTPGSFERFLANSTTTFNGYAGVTPVIQRRAADPPLSTQIIDGISAWTVLGTSTIDADGLNDIYYSTAVAYPRTFADRQAVNINRQLTFSRPNTLGTVTQIGKRTYIGLESVNVPLGTYSTACKFATELVTTYSATGQTITTLSTDWVVDALGIVKTVSNVKTTSATTPTTEVTTSTEATFAQPL